MLKLRRGITSRLAPLLPLLVADLYCRAGICCMSTIMLPRRQPNKLKQKRKTTSPHIFSPPSGRYSRRTMGAMTSSPPQEPPRSLVLPKLAERAIRRPKIVARVKSLSNERAMVPLTSAMGSLSNTPNCPLGRKKERRPIFHGVDFFRLSLTWKREGKYEIGERSSSPSRSAMSSSVSDDDEDFNFTIKLGDKSEWKMGSDDDFDVSDTEGVRKQCCPFFHSIDTQPPPPPPPPPPLQSKASSWSRHARRGTLQR